VKCKHNYGNRETGSPVVWLCHEPTTIQVNTHTAFQLQIGVLVIEKGDEVNSFCMFIAVFPQYSQDILGMLYALLNREIFWNFLMYFIQHCFICRPSDSTVAEDALILAVRRSRPQTRLDLIHKFGYDLLTFTDIPLVFEGKGCL
jgi:hypothetical protein